MPAAGPDAKIECPTPHHLQVELDTLGTFLNLGEKEETWDKIEKALFRFTGVVRGGGYKHLPLFVDAVGRKGYGLRVSEYMLSDRGRLSGAAVELLQTFAPRLGTHFAPLVQVYFDPLIKLFGRPNKVFLKRADKCLSTIISNCHLPTIVIELRKGLSDEAATCRRLCAIGIERALTEWEVETWTEKSLLALEEGLRRMATDKDPEVRQTGKRVWAKYTTAWPERVDEFSGPLTPTVRRYLNLPAANAVAPVKGKSKAPAVAPARPAPTSSSHTAQPDAVKGQHPRVATLAHKPSRAALKPGAPAAAESHAGPSKPHARSPPKPPAPLFDPSTPRPRDRPAPTRQVEPAAYVPQPPKPSVAHLARGALAPLPSHGRSVSDNALPKVDSAPSLGDEYQPRHAIRPDLPQSFSTTSVPTEASALVPLPPRLGRFATGPVRIVRPAVFSTPAIEDEQQQDDAAITSDAGPATPPGGNALRGPVRPPPTIGHGRRPLGQAQRRAVTAPASGEAGLALKTPARSVFLGRSVRERVERLDERAASASPRKSPRAGSSTPVASPHAKVSFTPSQSPRPHNAADEENPPGDLAVLEAHIVHDASASVEDVDVEVAVQVPLPVDDDREAVSTISPAEQTRVADVDLSATPITQAKAVTHEDTVAPVPVIEPDTPHIEESTVNDSVPITIAATETESVEAVPAVSDTHQTSYLSVSSEKDDLAPPTEQSSQSDSQLDVVLDSPVGGSGMPGTEQSANEGNEGSEEQQVPKDIGESEAQDAPPIVDSPAPSASSPPAAAPVLSEGVADITPAAASDLSDVIASEELVLPATLAPLPKPAESRTAPANTQAQPRRPASRSAPNRIVSARVVSGPSSQKNAAPAPAPPVPRKPPVPRAADASAPLPRPARPVERKPFRPATSAQTAAAAKVAKDQAATRVTAAAPSAKATVATAASSKEPPRSRVVSGQSKQPSRPPTAASVDVSQPAPAAPTKVIKTSSSLLAPTKASASRAAPTITTSARAPQHPAPTVTASATALPPVRKERIKLKAALPSFRPVRSSATTKPSAPTTTRPPTAASAARPAARVKPEFIPLPSSPADRPPLISAPSSSSTGRAKVRPEAIALPSSPALGHRPDLDHVKPETVPLPPSPHQPNPTLGPAPSPGLLLRNVGSASPLPPRCDSSASAKTTGAATASDMDSASEDDDMRGITFKVRSEQQTAPAPIPRPRVLRPSASDDEDDTVRMPPAGRTPSRQTSHTPTNTKTLTPKYTPNRRALEHRDANLRSPLVTSTVMLGEDGA